MTNPDIHAWMGGPIEGAARGAYTTGPHPGLDVLLTHLRDGDIVHGKTPQGELAFQGQLRGGSIEPLDEPSAAWLEMRKAGGPAREAPDGLGKVGAWLQLDKDEAATLFRLLDGKPGLLGGIGKKLGLCLSNVGHDEAFREAVQEKYAGRLQDGDLDFQVDGMVSKSDDGAYVMAFLWVTNAEAGIEGPEFDDEDGIPEP